MVGFQLWSSKYQTHGTFLKILFRKKHDICTYGHPGAQAQMFPHQVADYPVQPAPFLRVLLINHPEIKCKKYVIKYQSLSFEPSTCITYM